MKGWRTRDWVWLVGILIAIIVFVVTIRLDDNDDIVNMISLLSSSSSLTLAVIAIFQSSKNNSESNRTLEKVNDKLDSMDENILNIKEHVLNEAKEVINRSPMASEEKEEAIEAIRKHKNNIINEKVYDFNSKLNSTIAIKCNIEKNYSNDLKLNSELNKLHIILKKYINNEVRYRIEGTQQFTKDFLKDFSIKEGKVEIKLKDHNILTTNVKEVSFTEYDDRIDFWVYGDKVNRFNLSKNPNGYRSS